MLKSDVNSKQFQRVSFVRPIWNSPRKHRVGNPTPKIVLIFFLFQSRAVRFACSDYDQKSSVTKNCFFVFFGWKPLNERKRDLKLTFIRDIINNYVGWANEHQFSISKKRQRRHQNHLALISKTYNIHVWHITQVFFYTTFICVFRFSL